MLKVKNVDIICHKLTDVTGFFGNKEMSENTQN